MQTTLSELFPLEKPIFLPADLAKRPTQVEMVGRTIAVWSYAEHALGKSLAGMHRGTSNAAMQTYARRRNFSGEKNSRSALLRDAAGDLLEEPYKKAFLAVLEIIQGYSARRNDFAHGIWGIVEALPDALLLVEPSVLYLHWGAANDWVAQFARGLSEANYRADPLPLDKVEVWSTDDLRREGARMERAFELSVYLEAMCSVDSFDTQFGRRRQAFDLLCRDQEVAEKLQNSCPS